jgi:hypothetical protein
VTGESAWEGAHRASGLKEPAPAVLRRSLIWATAALFPSGSRQSRPLDGGQIINLPDLSLTVAATSDPILRVRSKG